MAKPFDATAKELLEKHPRAWLEFLLGRRLGDVRVVDADLSTITSESDKVFPESLKTICRAVALYHDFRYNVARVWERPVDEILAGDFATLPLAPIADVSSTELPVVIKRMGERFDTEADPRETADLWAATYFMMGLVYPENIAKGLLHGVRKMKESTTYQAILAKEEPKGKIEGAKRILFRMGRKRFGDPKAAIKSKIESIADLVQIEHLSDRVLEAKSWDELMKRGLMRETGTE